jgi:PhzF family phenazine biosynthesis protein
MKLPLYQVDAFTQRLFGGNPAAVVLFDAWLPDGVLAAIAAENNLAETAFVIPRADVSPLRWFTPAVEVDLCGHATLAAADVLFRYRFPSLNRLVFSTRSGELAVTREGTLLKMNFPARPGKPVAVTDALATALGARPREVSQMLADLRQPDLQIAVEVGAHPTHGSLITVTLKGLPVAARAQLQAQVHERLNPLETRHEIGWQ